jgi:hypothetical protein
VSKTAFDQGCKTGKPVRAYGAAQTTQVDEVDTHAVVTKTQECVRALGDIAIALQHMRNVDGVPGSHAASIEEHSVAAAAVGVSTSTSSSVASTSPMRLEGSGHIQDPPGGAMNGEQPGADVAFVTSSSVLSKGVSHGGGRDVVGRDGQNGDGVVSAQLRPEATERQPPKTPLPKKHNSAAAAAVETPNSGTGSEMVRTT